MRLKLSKMITLSMISISVLEHEYYLALKRPTKPKVFLKNLVFFMVILKPRTTNYF